MTDKNYDRNDGHYPDAWEQQRGETQRQFAVFREYRDMHPLERSLARVGEKLGCSTSYLERLSSQFQWVSRSTEWDREQDRSRRTRLQGELDEMHARHAAIAETALSKLTDRLQNLDYKELKPSQLAGLLEVAVRVERLARGESAETGAAEPIGIRADEIREMLRAEGLLGGGAHRPTAGDDDGEAIAESDPVAKWVNQHDGM